MNAPVPPHSRLLVLYSKPGCRLCDEALEVLEDAARIVPMEIREISILSDPVLYERHRHRIPVGVLDGREIFHLRTTLDAVLDAVRRQEQPVREVRRATDRRRRASRPSMRQRGGREA